MDRAACHGSEHPPPPPDRPLAARGTGRKPWHILGENGWRILTENLHTWVQTCRSPCHAWTAALERTDVARSDAACVAVLRPGDAALVRRFTRVAPAAGRGWIPGVYGRATAKERTRFGRTAVVCQGPQLRVLARDVGRAPHQ